MQRGGELGARVGGRAAVLSAPDTGGSFPLRSAAVVDAEPSTGDGDVELRGADVGAGVGRLDDHRLPCDGRARERELVAGAATGVARAHGGEAVGEGVGDGPGALVGAHVGVAAAAAGCGIGAVGDRLVVHVADFDGGGEGGHGPCAGGFAAVPVAGRRAGTGGLSCGGGEKGGEESGGGESLFVGVHTEGSLGGRGFVVRKERRGDRCKGE